MTSGEKSCRSLLGEGMMVVVVVRESMLAIVAIYYYREKGGERRAVTWVGGVLDKYMEG
jgi:hypothetical protein